MKEIVHINMLCNDLSIFSTMKHVTICRVIHLFLNIILYFYTSFCFLSVRVLQVMMQQHQLLVEVFQLMMSCMEILNVSTCIYVFSTLQCIFICQLFFVFYMHNFCCEWDITILRQYQNIVFTTNVAVFRDCFSFPTFGNPWCSQKCQLTKMQHSQ